MHKKSKRKINKWLLSNAIRRNTRFGRNLFLEIVQTKINRVSTVTSPIGGRIPHPVAQINPTDKAVMHKKSKRKINKWLLSNAIRRNTRFGRNLFLEIVQTKINRVSTVTSPIGGRIPHPVAQINPTDKAVMHKNQNEK